MFFAAVTGRRRIKKPTTVFQPWVLVEIQFTLDKRQRHRRLRRRPAELPVEHFLTLAQFSRLLAEGQAFIMTCLHRQPWQIDTPPLESGPCPRKLASRRLKRRVSC